MKRVLLLIIIIIGSINLANAQKYNWRKTAPKIHPKLILKYNPYALMNLNRSFYQFEAQHQFKNNLHFNHEFGFMSNATPFIEWTVSNASGLRLGSELRYYYSGMAKEGPSRFFGIAIRGENTSLVRRQTFDRAGGAYTQDINYEHKTNGVGVYGTFGGSLFLTKRIILDSRVGLGWRATYQDLVGIPEDAVLALGGFNWGLNPDQFIQGFDGGNVSLIIAIAVGYLIKE